MLDEIWAAATGFKDGSFEEQGREYHAAETAEPRWDHPIFGYGRHGVLVDLHSRTNPPIFWSDRMNSYVLVQDIDGEWRTPNGDRVALISVNGIGEVRWKVHGHTVHFDEEQGEAVRHYGLTPWQG